MAMRGKPPRTSALSAMWAEDASRGFGGIVKNGGTIYSTSPNVVTLRGKWMNFPGNFNARIEYPAVRLSTAVSFGLWYRNMDTANAWRYPISLGTAVNNSFNIQHNNSGAGDLRGYVRISGVDRGATNVGAIPNYWIGEHFLVVTWESGDNVRMFLDTVQVAVSGATYAGSISEYTGSTLLLGIHQSLGGPWLGDQAGTFVFGRRLSAQEVLDLYNNRSLR